MVHVPSHLEILCGAALGDSLGDNISEESIAYVVTAAQRFDSAMLLLERLHRLPIQF